MSSSTYKSNKIKTITAVGVFCALAYVCCVLFHFKVSFLTFDLKDAVMTVGAMIFGPLYGLAMTVIVALLEMITISNTDYYGFIMNIISSGVFVCIGSLIYSKKRTMKWAIIAEVIASISMVAAMMIANILITPYYLTVVLGKTISTAYVVKLIPTLLLPFNATKAIFNASIVFLIYNPISIALRSAGFVRNDLSLASSIKTSPMDLDATISKKRTTVTAITIAAAIIVSAITLVLFFTKLSGSFTFGI